MFASVVDVSCTHIISVVLVAFEVANAMSPIPILFGVLSASFDSATQPGSAANSDFSVAKVTRKAG